MIKLILTFILVFLLSTSFSQSRLKHTCDTFLLKYDMQNNQDTSKVYLTKCAFADTTEILLFGHVVDQNSFKPLVKAIVTLRLNNEIHTVTTDKDGYFKLKDFLSEGPGNNYEERHSKWELIVSHPNYECLKILKPIYANLEGFIVKLKKNSQL